MTSEKHIEFVQQIIARLNGNSFQFKTWAVTLTTGLFALSERSNPWFALLALVPILVFWCIDAHYLMLERRYRDLYKLLCLHVDEPDFAKRTNYSLELGDYPRLDYDMGSVFLSKTQLWIYLPLLITVALVIGVLKMQGMDAHAGGGLSFCGPHVS